MSEPRVKKKRYIGKVRSTQTQYGEMQKIYIDNIKPTKADGSADPYYKGALVWIDAETGKTVQVKQLSISVPRDGMNPSLVQKGYVAQISIDLEDKYEVDPID